MIALINGKIFNGFECLTDRALVIDGDTITGVLPVESLDSHVPTWDLQGRLVSAGFIDLQINGCGGVMFNDAPTVDTLAHMHQTNLCSGTTSFLPTLISDSDVAIRLGIEQVRTYQRAYPNQVLGMHLEGPYTNPQRRGIHPIDQLRQPDDAMIDWLAAQADALKVVTLAPEMNRGQHIRQLVKAGIHVSVGHSAATYQQAIDGFNQGITLATHLYNAMSPTSNGREPGVVGAVLDRRIYAGIIADGYHVHWANVRIAKRQLGEKLYLVTDATAGATPPKGMTQFDFCGATVYLRDGQCCDENGTLGGSALTMIEGIRRLVDYAGVSRNEALRMATLYPARAIGMDRYLGSIESGKIANLVVIDDAYRVCATMVNGEWTD